MELFTEDKRYNGLTKRAAKYIWQNLVVRCKT